VAVGDGHARHSREDGATMPASTLASRFALIPGSAAAVAAAASLLLLLRLLLLLA
jgi:hypothetical protein